MVLNLHAMANDYPTRLITVKVAFPAGGPADVSIRTASAMLQRRFGQPLIVENVPGAAGSISAMMVLKAKPDGYTLLGTAGTDLIAAPFTVVSAKYQPSAFKLVGLTAMADFILVSNPSLSFKNVDELIDYAKTPGNKELSLAHWGKGTTAHLVGADFQARSGATFLEVPYKGVAPALSDLSGGHADLTFAPLSGPTLELIQGGKVKAIALASDKRSPFLPDVPTINEGVKLKNFEHGIWSGIFVSADTSEPVVARLSRNGMDCGRGEPGSAWKNGDGGDGRAESAGVLQRNRRRSRRSSARSSSIGSDDAATSQRTLRPPIAASTALNE
jgi:tripartite-type tricarboxylate transporter receptor subunit TctC